MNKNHNSGKAKRKWPIYWCMAALLLATGACYTAQAEEIKTVDWYKLPENKTALETKLEECRNNPGELENTPNCKNARAAHSELFMNGGTYQKIQKPNYDF